MANPEHVEVVRRGAAAISGWRKRNPGEMFDLRGARLSSVNLTGADLSGADLRDADLAGTDLRGADLTVADLSQANLMDADLRWSDLTFADLKRADLSRAGVAVTVFHSTKLNGTIFDGTSCSIATFADCDLSSCLGLDTVEHRRPSSIGVDTLVHTLRGAGGVAFSPEQRTFFIGAGVPATLLDYLPGLVQENPLQFYSVFISYGTGTEDAKFANRLYRDLTERDIRCWKFDESAVMGRGLMANIDQAIRVYDKLIVVCSSDSLQRGPVLREIERALQKEDRLRGQGASDPDVLFPIRLDDYVIHEWEHERKADVQDKYVGDFRDPAKYGEQLDKLIEALDPRTWPLKAPV